MDFLDKILAKSSSADLVLITAMLLIVWLVATKRQIARQTVELAIKRVAGIAGGTLVVRAIMLIWG